MRRLLAILFLIVVKIAALAADPDLYVNFEGVADGTTASSSIMGTISKTNGNAVTFSYVGTPGSYVKVVNDTAHAGLLRPTRVNGTWYTNSSPTKALLCDSFSAGAVTKFMWTYAASRKVSAGFSITLTNWGSGFNFYNPGGFEQGGNYGVVSMVDDPTPYFQAETIDGTGDNINVGNFTIWVTLLWDSANQKTICAFYNQTNMVLLGYSSMPTTLNATVNTMGFGITGDHSFTANRNYYLNNLILYTNGNVWPVWPGTYLQCATNAARAGVEQAFTAASDGDSVILPATNITISSGITISRNRLDVSGIAPNGKGSNGTIITISGSIDLFSVNGYMNTFTNFQIKGSGTTENGTAFRTYGVSNIIGRNMYIRLGEFPIYAQHYTLVYGAVIADSRKQPGRVIYDNSPGPGSFYADYPLAWDSLKNTVFEDNLIYITSAKIQTSDNNLLSSQQAHSWVFRHNDVIINNSSFAPQPGFDSHGDDAGSGIPYPGVSVQIYSNRIHKSTGTWFGKFADIRGSRSLIYSNQVIGITTSDGIVYREERPGDSPNYKVTASYVWENYEGASGTTPMTVDNQTPGTIINNTDLFQTALDPLPAIPYPHPWRNESAGGGGGSTPDLSFTIGAPKLRGIRITR